MTDVENEVLVLLLMSPESFDELRGMFTEVDQQVLLALGGTVEAGLNVVLTELALRNLVRAVNPIGVDNKVWELTQQGEPVARRLVAQSTQP